MLSLWGSSDIEAPEMRDLRGAGSEVAGLRPDAPHHGATTTRSGLARAVVSAVVEGVRTAWSMGGEISSHWSSSHWPAVPVVALLDKHVSTVSASAEANRCGCGHQKLSFARLAAGTGRRDQSEAGRDHSTRRTLSELGSAEPEEPEPGSQQESRSAGLAVSGGGEGGKLGTPEVRVLSIAIIRA
jgi:hypothetical protein